MVFLGTLGWVQWYTLGGTVVHFGGYSGTLWGVQWYSCTGTVIQLYWYSGTVVLVQCLCISTVILSINAVMHSYLQYVYSLHEHRTMVPNLN